MRGSAFFDDIRQIGLEIGGQPGKVPVFCYDGRCMTALFAARRSARRALMPGSCYVPARLAPGLGAVSITCLEYRDCDIGPYNELAVGVPLNEPPPDRAGTRPPARLADAAAVRVRAADGGDPVRT